MLVDNITQTITTIPMAGKRGIDVQSIFVNKQEAFQDALTEVFVGQINTLRTQLNTFVEQLNTTTTQINTDAEIATNAAERATAINNELKNVSVDSTITGMPGTPARVTYSPITGKFTFVIPRGEAFQIDARGALTDRSLYDTKYQGFGFLALDESKVYFKMSSTSGDWSVGLYFGKGDGIVNTVFTSTTDPSGLAGQSGATDTYTINYSNLETDTFIIKNGEDGLDNITDTVIGTETTWSSTKIKELLAQKADKLELDQRIDSLDSTVVKLTENQTISGVKTFSSSPVVPNPTTNTQAANKAYVDNATDSALPKGFIGMWSGSIASIPTGWALCNGANGTPDLRDSFIVGAGSSYGVGARGGSKDSIVVAHTHTGTAASAGAHTHTIDAGVSDDGHVLKSADWNVPTTGTGTTNSSGEHTHTVAINSTGSSGANANLPPYYALAFIMKI